MSGRSSHLVVVGAVVQVSVDTPDQFFDPLPAVSNGGNANLQRPQDRSLTVREAIMPVL